MKSGLDDSFKKLLLDQGLKYTHERRQIFEEIQKQKSHFDADGFYQQLKEKGLRISRDTVYRTLPLLLESGTIQKSVGKGKGDFFERVGIHGHHDHLVCVSCGVVVEFACDEIENLQDDICEEHGFKLLFHDHRLFGKCKSCNQAKR